MPRSERTHPFAVKNASHLPMSVRPLRSCFPTAAETPYPHTCNQPGGKPFRKLDRITFPARHRCGAASLCRLLKSGM